MQNRKPESGRNTDNIVTTQKYLRRWLTQQRFTINRLSKGSNYPVFVVGNAPLITGLEKFKSRTGIALISLSGLRSISIACSLGNKTHVPKIFLVDISEQVHQFWQGIKNIAEECDNAAIFLKKVHEFLENNPTIYRRIRTRMTQPGVIYPDQNIDNYLNELLSAHGYKYIRRIIRNVALIKQSWADKELFIKLKNIISLLEIKDIYVYASNVVSLVESEADRNSILENIKNIDPVLAIHHDYCSVHKVPEKVLMLKNHEPAYVKSMLESDYASHWIHMATLNGYHHLVMMLITQDNKNLERRSNDGSTPLMMAVGHDKPQIAGYLLNQGANPNSARPDRTTPLLIAAGCDNKEMANLLLRYGANLPSALHQALEKNLDKPFKMLLDIQMKKFDKSLDASSDFRRRAIEKLKEVVNHAKDASITVRSIAILCNIDSLACKPENMNGKASLIDKAYYHFTLNPHDDLIVKQLSGKTEQLTISHVSYQQAKNTR